MSYTRNMAGKIKFYGDEHIRRQIAKGIIERGYEFVLAIDLGMLAKDDDTQHIPFAASLGAVIVTFDKPFAGRTQSRVDHAGMVCWTGDHADIGGIIRALIEFAEQYTPDEVRGRVFWLKR